MATRIMSDIEFLKVLKSFDKSYFTVADLEKILELERDSLYVTLNRLVKAGVFIKLRRGVYKTGYYR
ncbi:MAG: type IV toxin-antitoxin system AbiEi family antitoxin domain-containing protein [Candidatus Hydromicrobium sp.]